MADAVNKFTENKLDYFKEIGISIDKHGEMQDLINELPDQKWLLLIEDVTSRDPFDIKRQYELGSLFGESSNGLVFITAFESGRVMNRYLAEIDWNTGVWVAESPGYLIHFNGDRFLGPYSI